MARTTVVTPRRTLLAVSILIATGFAITALLVPSTEAASSSSCTYYSNASYTTVVGQYGYDCCHNYVAWGIKTKYAQCGGCFICYPPNP